MQRNAYGRKVQAGIAASIAIAACLLALAFGLALPWTGAGCGAAYATAGASAFAYDGDAVDFTTDDGESQFGMFRREGGSWVEYQNGQIVVEHVVNNKTVYAGFYLEAYIDDPSTWDSSRFCGRNDAAALSFAIDPSYAGGAWPIAPVKYSDPTATTTGQYYLLVPPLEKIPGYLLKVTFADGFGNDLFETTVASGGDVEPPDDPEHEGCVFMGWDQPLENITQDTVVTALWAEEGAVTYTVTFEDGWGKVLKTRHVSEGAAATPPADPTYPGYTFNGWDPATFNEITSDLVVVATWVSDDDNALAMLKDAIGALPEDPKTLVGDTENELVATAVATYGSASDTVKAQLTEDEMLQLAKCAIAVLPRDPFTVASAHQGIIENAQALFDALPENLQARLDSEVLSSSRPYGRYLENGVWALDALKAVNNVTLLKDGTYTNTENQVSSTFNRGKNPRKSDIVFTVKSVIVKGGRATAVVEQNSNSSEWLSIGGVQYQNLQPDDRKYSYFEIPINLHSTFHFSTKGKEAQSSVTDAITYEMTVSCDESSMTPDSKSSEGDSGDDASSGNGGQKSSDDNSGSGGKASGDGANGDGSSSGENGSTSQTTTSQTTPAGTTPASTATGATPATANPSAATTPLGAGAGSQTSRATTSTQGSTAGNLSSLLRTSSTQGTSSSAAASKSSASASKSGASASSAGSASKAGKTGEEGAKGENGASPEEADGNRASVQEIARADGAGSGDDVDLAPAVAGGSMLSVSLGVLAFVLRFVRRESAFL